jgi:tetratricopeptide (TPR) repeat protein
MLGRDLCALGRFEEAEPLAEKGRELGDVDDVMTQALWRQVRALVLAQRGERTEAERLGREAVALAEQTDSPQMQGDALFDLGEVLDASGRRQDAVAAWQEALARSVRERLAALEPA